MNRTKKVRLVSISFLLVFMLISMLTLYLTVSDTYSVPYIGIGGDDSIDDDPPNAHDSPGDNFALPAEDGSSTVLLDASDISRGELLLINFENSYELPDGLHLVDLSEFKTPSYMVTDGVQLLSGLVIGPLNEMMDAFFSETGLENVSIVSAFRDNTRQQEIFDSYVALLGAREAERYAARPGHSEHNAGLAVDFGILSGGVSKTFYGTGDYFWFFKNSYLYGFIPRYPEHKADITKTNYEPWHFRYVGVPHSYFIHQNGLCLEEYMEFVTGFTVNEPYIATCNGENYEVYFTRDTSIRIPPGYEHDISGNNIDGFIVTLKPPA